MNSNIKATFKYLLTSIICSSYSFSIAQTKSVYLNEFEQVKTNTYNKKLISLSPISPDKNWNNYKGGEIYTTDSLFSFDSKNLSEAFPTHYGKVKNEYLIHYFSQKTAKCPTLFSLLKYYEPIIDAELSKNDLPKELKLIPVVCSAFNQTSNNGNGGYGYWHLNHPQAVKYGLNITEYVDERKDFVKSTKAAIKYIKDLYLKYNDWELTLAAYSSGVVNVTKLFKRHNASTYKEIAAFLPEATKDFVQAFVAMNYVYNYDSYGVVQLSPKIIADTVTIDRKLKIKAINDIIKTKSSDLLFLNPTLIKETLPTNFVAYFPLGTKNKFIEMKDSIYFYQDSILLKPEPKAPAIVIPKDGEPYEYTVRSGDVLGLIADRHNVRVSQIQSWNNLDGTRINVGQRLMIYGKKSLNKTQKQKTKNKVEPKETTKPNLTFNSSKYSNYTVKSGDNLWLIAKKYSGISAQNIMDFNGIDGNLDVGQILKIPKP
ncbi:MAG: LysM peptidoglycan-binding domain-containing protein [Vicingaceae bacterium]|nr:LysM peptidoglycan-binding domain-containing protein [Vicingaceae bacterium]